jgi:NADH-quinone oxidoreductase subunit N
MASAEIFVLAMGCVLLVFDVWIKDKYRILSYAMAQLTVIAAAVITLMTFPSTTSFTFDGSYINDPLAAVLKLFIYLVTAFVFLYSRDYLKDRNIFRGEYYVLGLFGMLGMMIMVSAHSFLTVFIRGSHEILCAWCNRIGYVAVWHVHDLWRNRFTRYQ